jgi:hypothetical protein
VTVARGWDDGVGDTDDAADEHAANAIAMTADKPKTRYGALARCRSAVIKISRP